MPRGVSRWCVKAGKRYLILIQNMTIFNVKTTTRIGESTRFKTEREANFLRDNLGFGEVIKMNKEGKTDD